MQNFHKRRRPVTPQTFLITITAVGLVIALLVSSFVNPSIPALITRPLLIAGASASAGASSLHYFLPQSSETKSALDQEIAENQILQNENRELREKLGDLGRLGGDAGLKPNTVTAAVLEHPPISPYDTLLITISNNAQVKAGSFVYAQGGVPIGTIDAASSGGAARVVLFSSPGRATSGWIGEKRLPVTVQGDSAGAFTAVVSNDAQVAEGDLLYLPAPAAMPVGIVMRTDSDPASTNTILEIRPYVNIFSLTWVEVAL